tara:strand:+ start:1613 stop:1846 length:234 start_codon:yes stop_codon:yes gene_type:complete
MKFLIEYLDIKKDSINRKYYSLNKSKSLEFIDIIKAKKEFNILKLSKLSTELIRIIEYHNDESDLIRNPCIIIDEFN